MNLQDSLVLIKSQGERKDIGTGFVIYRDRSTSYIVTCAHVVKAVGGKDNVKVRGKKATVIAYGWDLVEDGLDLAVLQVEGLDLPSLNLFPEAREKLHFSTKGFFYFDQGRVIEIREVTGTLKQARTLAIREGEDFINGWELEITSEDFLREGYSGSPILNQQQEVIGVVTHLLENGRKGAGISITALAKCWLEMPSSLLNFNEFREDLGNGVQLEMVAIPEGSFMMGSPEDEEGHRKSESPQHQVTVKCFFMGKYPVTQAQWKAVAALPKINRELNPDPSHFKGANRPVECVSWLDAVEFCDRLSQHTKKLYRLPSEAEWEYACRAGTTTPFHFGETITTDLANYDGNYTYGAGSKGIYREQTTPVGSFGVANAFGLYDMHGNVWEWCADRWHDNYEGAPNDGTAWVERNENKNDSQIFGVLRGGSWNDYPNYCRSAFRNDFGRRDYHNIPYGFRVVCESGRTQ